MSHINDFPQIKGWGKMRQWHITDGRSSFPLNSPKVCAQSVEWRALFSQLRRLKGIIKINVPSSCVCCEGGRAGFGWMCAGDLTWRSIFTCSWSARRSHERKSLRHSAEVKNSQTPTPEMVRVCIASTWTNWAEECGGRLWQAALALWGGVL